MAEFPKTRHFIPVIIIPSKVNHVSCFQTPSTSVYLGLQCSNYSVSLSKPLLPRLLFFCCFSRDFFQKIKKQKKLIPPQYVNDLLYSSLTVNFYI